MHISIRTNSCVCRNKQQDLRNNNFNQRGVSLVELIFFIIVIGIASSVLFRVYNYSLLHSVDPITEVRALELVERVREICGTDSVAVVQ